VATALLLLAGCTKSQPPPAPAQTATTTADACAAAPPAPSPAASPPAGMTFEAGSAGLGDPYYPKAGNGGYDVLDYYLDLRYDPKAHRLSGTTTITATATENLSRFNLDLHGLTVDKVTVNGAGATASRAGDEMTVAPATGLVRGTRFVTAVTYNGVPKSYSEPGLGESGFLYRDDTAVAIGEPEVAAAWFPVNDHPRDKATYTIRIEVPDGLVALSNGVMACKVSASGLTVWTWHESAPMASYLATLVIGHYRVTQSTHNGRPVVLAVAASLPQDVDTQMAKTPAIIDFLQTQFGPYPFDALGGIVIDDARVRFALENQSRPVYGAGFFDKGEDAGWVIAHELAHQWYGDSVSVDTWKEIWLNEGFATYAEWLYEEHTGARTVNQAFNAQYDRSGDEIWKVPPGNPGQADLFGNSVYGRGAMALHALRRDVGDSAFFTILKRWAADRAGSTGTTAQFQALAEQISGKQLDSLFQAWLYGTTRPPKPA
jgi:aminopeptidase N